MPILFSTILHRHPITSIVSPFSALRRLRAIRPLIPALALGLTALAHADDSPLTSEEAVRIALDRNPDLKAARWAIAEAGGRAQAAGRLPNPEIDAELAVGRESEGRASAGITQRFPLTARLSQERQLSALEIDAASWEVRVRAHQLAAATRAAFHELAAAREATQLARRQTGLAAAFAVSTRQGVAQGFGSAFDADQAELVVETARFHETAAEAGEVSARARLAGLLGFPAAHPLPLRGALVLPGALPAEQSIGTRPDVRLAEILVAAGHTDVRLARASTWADMGAGVFVDGERFADAPGGIEPEALVGLRINLPLPIWTDGRGKIAEKSAVARRKEAALEAVRYAATHQVLAALELMALRYRAAVHASSKLVPAARKQVGDAEAAFGRGEVAIQTVFQTRERLAQIESAAIEARKTYFLSHAAWLEALGEPTPP